MDKEFMKGVFWKKASFFVWKQGLFYVMIKRPVVTERKKRNTKENKGRYRK